MPTNQGLSKALLLKLSLKKSNTGGDHEAVMEGEVIPALPNDATNAY